MSSFRSAGNFEISPDRVFGFLAGDWRLRWRHPRRTGATDAAASLGFRATAPSCARTARWVSWSWWILRHRPLHLGGAVFQPPPSPCIIPKTRPFAAPDDPLPGTDPPSTPSLSFVDLPKTLTLTLLLSSSTMTGQALVSDLCRRACRIF